MVKRNLLLTSVMIAFVASILIISLSAPVIADPGDKKQKPITTEDVDFDDRSLASFYGWKNLDPEPSPGDTCDGGDRVFLQKTDTVKAWPYDGVSKNSDDEDWFKYESKDSIKGFTYYYSDNIPDISEIEKHTAHAEKAEIKAEEADAKYLESGDPKDAEKAMKERNKIEMEMMKVALAEHGTIEKTGKYEELDSLKIEDPKKDPAKHPFLKIEDKTKFTCGEQVLKDEKSKLEYSDNETTEWVKAMKEHKEKKEKEMKVGKGEHAGHEHHDHPKKK